METFLLPDGSVLLNEVAPRPHNSGHYTIEACPTSQFEAHLRAVLGWPLGDCGLRVGASIMLNILGEAEGEEGERLAHELMGRAYAVPGASVHWYGKAGVAANRKVGHITIVGKDNQECRDRLRAIDPGGGQGWQPGVLHSAAQPANSAALLARAALCSAVRRCAVRVLGVGSLFQPAACCMLRARWLRCGGSPAGRLAPLLSLPAAAADAIEGASSKVANDLQAGSSSGGGGGGVSVGIIMGSDSDLATMKGAAEILEEFGVPCEVTVVSAHR